MTGSKEKLIRITTVPESLNILLRHQLKFMSQHFDVLGIASPGPQLEEVASREGIRTMAVTMSRAITPASDLSGVYKLYRVLKREKPLIVHTHTPKAGLLGMMAAKLAGVPIRMHTVAGMPLMEATGNKRRILEQVEKLTYSFATGVYPNSAKLADFILQNRFCTASKLKVLGNGSSNGINTDFFREDEQVKSDAQKWRAEFGFDGSEFVFVFVGRLVKDKGIVELVDAFTRLHENNPRSRLILVGPFESHLDPLPEKTHKTIVEHPAIFSPGFQKDVRPFLAVSHALAFPSYREGFPNVPMQAGCFNLPSVVTDINGCNEIVENGVNGLIVPTKDTDSLYAAMEQLLNNEELYVRLKSVSRKMIVDRFEQTHIWQLLLQEYQQQIKKTQRVS